MDKHHDHRVLGRELGVFDTSALVGPGLPLWLPDGAVIRAELERFAAEQAAASGCRRVYSPVLAKRELFERSGHWDKFSQDMFPVMNLGGEELVLRPANCPSHVQIYQAGAHSWRDLPVRFSEAGAMFRSELSGVLGGLSRVRQINLDDAHVFCRDDQVIDEVELAISAVRECYRVLGIEISYFRLSVRGDGGEFAGDDGVWEHAEQQLCQALENQHVPFLRAEGEAAFYGPKIDVQVLDAGGREETLSTVQVDHVLPERFDLSYIGADGASHRPVMVHRGLLSSMERMVALLIERYAGRFPAWLSPLQVAVLPVSEHSHGEAANDFLNELAAAGLRSEMLARGTLSSRIRQARQRRAHRIAVVGQSEIESGTVSVGEERIPRGTFIAAVRREIEQRSPSGSS